MAYLPWENGLKNWKNNEPNDHNSGNDGEENCAHMLGSGGQWNDLHCTEDTTGAYVIEYG